ncbi:MAG: DUF4391 domain-containing protein [Candidatus Wallbacteria bacterium HGW-Wallbacteria-1]|jgi:hypothetical protein|uniref:DUF4391 domain-containing protein n=1 Tax=Candidatus Wallbacteria bacterium HGW-Wallbacteria-1 TaxID=2013854 RepID=A0A2N1PJ91_9BACT|nr:MAG: DUF4391 domain-containing protein [Candidatus Wallbacteria bacterium HGW-Wallbacteria-1]
MPDNKKAAIEYVWNMISFPEAALLGKRVPKKQFLESCELVASDKKLFRENVKNVYWEYTLKPSTCPVLPFRDNEREYLEVAVLRVEMNFQKGHKRIAEIIHRVIPYPLMLGLYTETGEFALSIAPKRFSQAEHGAFVAERFFTTGWMNCDRLNEWEAAFVQSLAWSNLPLQNYGSLYNAWTDRFTGYECSVLSGTFAIGKAGNRLERLTHCRQVESKISELRGQLKKAAFNRQVELNTQIKKFEQELKQLAGSL